MYIWLLVGVEVVEQLLRHGILVRSHCFQPLLCQVHRLVRLRHVGPKVLKLSSEDVAMPKKETVLGSVAGADLGQRRLATSTKMH